MFAPRRIPSELLPPPAKKVECDRWVSCALSCLASR
jgi:hypothetical protein